MTDGSIALACKGLTKRYGRVTALRAVDLAVRPGECVALFGRNGAGKTTLLQIAGSLVRGYDGEVQLFGANIKKTDAEAKRAVGLVLHDTCLYLDLSVLDNLRFFARLYRVPDPDARARDLLERFDLDTRGKSIARELSRGMKQRLAIARAMVHQPRLLLLDEPYTGLDEISCQSLSTMLSTFAREGGAVLMSTHDVERAFQAVTRAVILEKGTITFDRSAADVDVPAFRHAYWNVLFTGGTREATGDRAGA